MSAADSKHLTGFALWEQLAPARIVCGNSVQSSKVELFPIVPLDSLVHVATTC